MMMVSNINWIIYLFKRFEINGQLNQFSVLESLELIVVAEVGKEVGKQSPDILRKNNVIIKTFRQQIILV